MNDSLALEVKASLPDHSLVASLIVPTLGATVPAGRKASRPRSPVEGARTPLPLSATIVDRLRIGAPELLARANAAAQARFVELLCKRLGALVSNALIVFRSHVGELAISLDPAQREQLQDLALTIRLPTDDLVAQAVRALSPSELVAHLAAACEVHSPGGLDTLRCRDLVYGGRDPLAREAMLDLAIAGQPDRSGPMFEQLVSSRMIARFKQSVSLTPATIKRLRARCLGSERPEAKTGGRTRGTEPVIQDELTQAIRRGENYSAIALLASAAGVSRATVETAVCLRTPKGLMSLVWRAGCDAALAVTIQSALGRLPPDQILRPMPNGGFPLTGPEMLWQCRFLDHTQRAFQ